MIMEHIYHSETLYFTTNLSLVLFFSLGLGVAVLAIGLAFRALVSYLAVLGTDLSFKERLFIPVAWLPKATVQVSIVLITTEFNPFGDLCSKLQPVVFPLPLLRSHRKHVTKRTREDAQNPCHYFDIRHIIKQ